MRIPLRGEEEDAISESAPQRRTVMLVRAFLLLTIKLNCDPGTPSVTFISKDLKGETEFVIDSGSEPNILKIKMANDYLLCDEADKIKLSGNTNETVTTYSSCIIRHLRASCRISSCTKLLPHPA